MHVKLKWQFLVITVFSVVLLSACGSSSSGDKSDGDNGDQALLAQIEQLFPFTPNQTFDVIYSCARLGSVLEYIFDLRNDGTFELTITTNVGQDVSQAGTYTYQNNEIRLQTGAPAGAILFNLDETTTQIVVAFGLAAAFQTPSMVCGAIGHRENAVEFNSIVHYDCPNINIEAVSFDVNAIEFVLQTIPFNRLVPGSAFRARDRFVSGNPQAIIRRGNGLYRRAGDDFYIFFAPGTFDDNNVLSGEFRNLNMQISVDQLEPNRGDCSQ